MTQTDNKPALYHQVREWLRAQRPDLEGVPRLDSLAGLDGQGAGNASPDLLAAAGMAAAAYLLWQGEKASQTKRRAAAAAMAGLGIGCYTGSASVRAIASGVLVYLAWGKAPGKGGEPQRRF
jgi:uncharacterized protein HemX